MQSWTQRVLHAAVVSAQTLSSCCSPATQLPAQYFHTCNWLSTPLSIHSPQLSIKNCHHHPSSIQITVTHNSVTQRTTQPWGRLLLLLLFNLHSPGGIFLLKKQHQNCSISLASDWIPKHQAATNEHGHTRAEGGLEGNGCCLNTAAPRGSSPVFLEWLISAGWTPQERGGAQQPHQAAHGTQQLCLPCWHPNHSPQRCCSGWSQRFDTALEPTQEPN